MYGHLALVGRSLILPRLIQKQSFLNHSTGTDYIVPAGANFLHVVTWGAAGGGLNYPDWSPNYPGGGGGFAEGIVPVTPGETLSARVGRGGANSASGYATNNGGGVPTNSPGACGGGYSGLFRGNAPLIIAAGGGSGGGLADGANGGPGGGLTSLTVQKGSTTVTGATQSSGGSGSGPNGGTAGYGLQGAAAGWSAGGGGYNGGGAAYTSFGTGGSSFMGSSGLQKGRTISGNVNGVGNPAHPDYVSGYATGYTQANGSGGILIIRAYNIPPKLEY